MPAIGGGGSLGSRGAAQGGAPQDAGTGAAGPSWPSPGPTGMVLGWGRVSGSWDGCRAVAVVAVCLAPGCAVTWWQNQRDPGLLLGPAPGAPGSEQTPPGEAKFEQPKPPVTAGWWHRYQLPMLARLSSFFFFFNLIFTFCTLRFQALGEMVQVQLAAPHRLIAALGEAPGVAAAPA